MKHIILAYREYTQASSRENSPTVSLVSLSRGRLSAVPDMSEFTECRDLAELGYMTSAIAKKLDAGSDIYIRATNTPMTHAEVSHDFIAPLTNAAAAKKMPVGIVTLCIREGDGVCEYRLFGSRDLPIPDEHKEWTLGTLMNFLTSPFDDDDNDDDDSDSGDNNGGNNDNFDPASPEASTPDASGTANGTASGGVQLKTEVKKVEAGKVGRAVVSSIFDWYELFAYAIAAVLVVMSFFVRHSPVEGSSMYPTLVGHSSAPSSTTVAKGYDVLLVSGIYELDHGDIVIIQEPTQPTEPIVKRIIAMGGDKIKIDFTNGDVFLNGEKLDEDYINEKDIQIPTESLIPNEFGIWEDTVPEGKIFVLGDNRRVSKDSRYFGFIDERNVIGKAVLRILPLDKFGKLN